jgi:hypothetical protein
MVRTSQAITFSSSPYFDDRGTHGVAEPITERVNVSFACTQFSFIPSEVDFSLILDP